MNWTHLSYTEVWPYHTFKKANFLFMSVSVFSEHCVCLLILRMLIFDQNLTANSGKTKKIIGSKNSGVNPFKKSLGVALYSHFSSLEYR